MADAHRYTSRERLLDTLNHKQPDRIPIDFGGTSVTGMHASCVAALRDYYGLEKRPVKVHEPSQMLGLVEDDLKEAMGVDVIGVFRRGTKWGVPAERWKPWEFNGLEVLVPGEFNTTVDANGDTLGLSRGRHYGRAQRTDAEGRILLRQHHPPGADRRREAESRRQYGGVSADLAGGSRLHGERGERGRGDGARRDCGFGGTAFGDISLVPGPALKHPKGIRDVTEWYVSTRSRQDYIHKVFERQCEIALANLERIYAVVGDRCRRFTFAGRISARRLRHSAP